MPPFKPGDVGHLAEHDRIAAELVGIPATMASVAADPTSEFAIQQNATIVELAEPRRESDSLMGFFAALAQRDTAPVDILVCGDSIVEGEGATTVTKRWINRMVSTLRARLGVTGGGVGYVPARYGATSIASEDWVLANRTVENTFGLGLRSVSLLMDQSTGLGDGTATITRTCTSFKIVANPHATSATSLFVSIDGGASTVWDLPAGAGVLTWVSGALAPGAHTVVVKARSNSAAYLNGAIFYNGDESTGIRLWDGAKSGTRADQFNAETLNGDLWARSLSVVNPDLLIIEWITNDAIARTPAQYEVSLQAVVDLARTNVPNVPILLLAPYERASGVLLAPWSEYLAKMQAVRDANTNVAFLDLGQRIPTPFGADTYSILADAVHPNDKGHALIADAVAGFLTPQ